MLIHARTSLGTCRSCGAAIEWATTATGKRIPFNPPIVQVRSPLGGTLVEVDPRTVTHFTTCPDADHWRRPR